MSDEAYLDALEAYSPPRPRRRGRRLSAPAIFNQSAVWVDAHGVTWSLTDLQTDHLDNLVSWITDFQSELHGYYAAYEQAQGRAKVRPLLKTPLVRALLREQKRRTIPVIDNAPVVGAELAVQTITGWYMERGITHIAAKGRAKEIIDRLIGKGFELRKKTD